MSQITNLMKEKILSQAGAGRVFFVMDNDKAYKNEMQEVFGDLVNVYDNVTDAVGAAVTGRGDTIFVFPGSYEEAASVTVNKDSLRIVGLSVDGKGADVSLDGRSDADEILNVTADKVVIEGIRFDLYSTTKNGVVFGESAPNFYCVVKKCTFIGGAIQLKVADTYDAPHFVVEDCKFSGATTAAITMNATEGLISNCRINAAGIATVDLVHIYPNGSAGRRDMSIDGCTILGIGATDGIDIDAGISNFNIIRTVIGGATNELTDGGTATEGLISYTDGSGGTLISP